MKERRRLSALAAVPAGTLSLVKAAEVMSLCYRQAKRVWARYQKEGDRGLVHRARGLPSATAKIRVRDAQEKKITWPMVRTDLSAAFISPIVLLKNALSSRR